MMKAPTVESRSANELYIYTDEGVFLQSYRSIIAFQSRKGQVYLNRDYYGYSKTTAIHRNRFLSVTAKEFNDNLRDGKYKVVDMENIGWFDEQDAA